MHNYYSGFAHALIFVIGALTGITVFYLIPLSDFPQIVIEFVPALATLLAAYFGAKFAFNFQNTKDKVEEDKKDQTDIKLLIFKLIDMLNHLAVYEMQLVDPVRNDPNLADEFLFLAIKPTDTSHMVVDLDPYTVFSITQGKHINLLSEVSMRKASYHSTVDLITFRSTLHASIQNKLDAAGVDGSTLLDLEAIIKLIGDKDYKTLKDSTDDILEIIPNNIDRILNLIVEIKKASKEKYPAIEIPAVDFSIYLERDKPEQ